MAHLHAYTLPMGAAMGTYALVRALATVHPPCTISACSIHTRHDCLRPVIDCN
jgi:predicted LPLAT superfamily acyltransferase